MNDRRINTSKCYPANYVRKPFVITSHWSLRVHFVSRFYYQPTHVPNLTVTISCQLSRFCKYELQTQLRISYGIRKTSYQSDTVPALH